MTPELNPELRQAIRAIGGSQPLRVVDPDTQTMYVLVPAKDYDRITERIPADDDLAATYPAQLDAALRAGWGAPEMDAYDNYDENRKKLCP